MNSRTLPLPKRSEERGIGKDPSDVKTNEHIASGRLTYGGFISLLQSLQVEHRSVRTPRYGMPIGQGTYFQVYRHTVSPIDYQSLWSSITGRGDKPFQTPVLPVGTHVAIKRMVVKERFGKVSISGPGQLFAIWQEIMVLLHPDLREHDCIVKLQAIIWENGLGPGYEDGELLWPSLVMEYCETTLAEYQSCNTLTPLQGITIGSKIGEGLDALHSANIFHGDLKAENILLKVDKSGNLEPKLADFGCSVTFKDEQGKTKYYVAGTALWSAPECPGSFATMEEIEATDYYSFGLLLLRMGMNGKNPFEEFGVIPENWTHEEKLVAVHTLKESDCLPALLFGTRTFETLTPPERFLVNAFIADPAKRMSAINGMDLEEEINIAIKTMQSLDFDGPEHALVAEMAAKYVEETARQNLHSSSELEHIGTKNLEEEPDGRDPLSFVRSFAEKNIIPDIDALSKMELSIALNPSTRARIVEEITSNLEEEDIYPRAHRCPECCRLTVVDTNPASLTPGKLLQVVQDNAQNPIFDHACIIARSSDLSPDHLLLSAALLGEIRSPEVDRTWKLLWQLFLATSTGFGTQQDKFRALDILEQACTSGFSAAYHYYRYAAYTKQSVDPDLPIRSWLVQSALFSAGIPSDAFTALQEIDPHLAKLVSIARSMVYNGSTAAFENYRFISRNSRTKFTFEIKPGYVSDFSLDERGFVVQNEQFHNTLLHLAAGSYGSDLSLITYCVNVLDIDINVRNASSATPLLLACRAAREEKILTLLKLGASVHIKFDAGETPLHWLGLLPDPSRVLKEFVKRGADINAQVNSPKLLPNFIGGSRTFFRTGGPLVWAMAMDSEVYVDALLREGADIHFPGPTGLTPISMACWPRFSKFLPRLSREKPFKVRDEDVYRIVARWGPWRKTARVTQSIKVEEQEDVLELVLSYAGFFDDIGEVYKFYHHVVSYSVSNSRFQILEIILKALSRAMELVRNPEPDHGIYVKLPLSHHLWKNHRYVHEAARRGDAEILTAVLKMHAGATSVDDFGWTPLHMLSSQSDNPDCVDVLISQGAREVLDARIPGWGLSAFMNALSCCNFRVADRILSYIPTDQRKTLLSTQPALGLPVPGLSLVGHFVVWSPYFGKAPLDFLFGLPEIRDEPESIFIADGKDRKTLLMVAAGFVCDGSIYDPELFATSRRSETYRFLMAKFPTNEHLNAKDNWGSTAMHLAAWAGNSEIATMLMDRGANLNAEDNFGYTPLDSLYHDKPPFLNEERDAKKAMIAEFSEGRKNISKALRQRGGRRKIRVTHPEAAAKDSPRPEA